MLRAIKLLQAHSPRQNMRTPCDTCWEYKAKRDPVPASKTTRPTVTKQVTKMYFDASGCMDTESIYHKYQYYMLGVTDVGFKMVKGMTYKSQSLFVIGRMFAELGQAPKYSQVDGAGELASEHAKRFFVHWKTHRVKTEAYEHHRNAKAENGHQKLKEMGRCCLAHAHAPLEFWYLCLTHMALTANLLLRAQDPKTDKHEHSIGHKCTAWEAHYGVKPNINRFLIAPWGCLAYLCLSREQRDKKKMNKHWGARAIAGIFVGCHVEASTEAYNFLIFDGRTIFAQTSHIRVVGDCFPFKLQLGRDASVLPADQDDYEDPEEPYDTTVSGLDKSCKKMGTYEDITERDLSHLHKLEHTRHMAQLSQHFVFIGKATGSSDSEPAKRFRKRALASLRAGRAKLVEYDGKTPAFNQTRKVSAPRPRFDETQLRKDFFKATDNKSEHGLPKVQEALRDDYLKVLDKDPNHHAALRHPQDDTVPPSPHDFKFVKPYDSARYYIAVPVDFSDEQQVPKTPKLYEEKFIGRRVRRPFPVKRKVKGSVTEVMENFEGTVISYSPSRHYFRIKFDDDDVAEMDVLELEDWLIMDVKAGDDKQHHGQTRAELNELLKESVLPCSCKR